MTGQQLCRYLAHITDTQGSEQTGKRGMLSPLNGSQRIIRRLFPPAGKTCKIFTPQAKDIGNIGDKTCLHQLLHVPVAKAFDIEPGFTGKVDQALHPLGRTVRINTTGDGLARRPVQRMRTDRAGVRKNDWPLTAGALFHHRFHNFRDHIPGSLDKDRVADHQPLALYFIPIVEAGSADNGTVNLHRLQDSDRRNRTGSPDLKIDIQDHSRSLDGREFPGHRPARGSGSVAQPLLEGKITYLDHHTVNLVFQTVPDLLQLLILSPHVGQGITKTDQGIDPKSDPPQPGKKLVQVAAGHPADIGHPIDKKAEWPGSGYLGVKLTQGTGCRIPRIGEQRFFPGGPLPIQVGKPLAR